MKISAVAYSERGMQLGKLLKQKSNIEFSLSLRSKDALRLWTEENHSGSLALIYIGSLEDSIRAISHFVGFKSFECAVVTVDELSKFAVPVISGKSLSANLLAVQLADILKCIPVITSEDTAEDTFSVDKWAKSIGLRVANPQAAKFVSLKIASGENVYFNSVFKISGEAPRGILPAGDMDVVDFSISYLSSVPEKVLQLVPPVLTLGIDCKDGADCESIESAYIKFLCECGCHPLAVFKVCSIASASACTGLKDFCKKHSLQLRLFSFDELSRAKGRFSAPETDSVYRGIDNVCERSAVLGSNGTLFVRKMSFSNISMAIAINEPDPSK